MSTPSDGLMKVRTQDEDDSTVRTTEPELFDSSGMRAPYREGPYDYFHNEDGRLIKKRWCELVRLRNLLLCQNSSNHCPSSVLDFATLLPGR